jgi:membrane associated rhomboid family serine protease
MSQPDLFVVCKNCQAEVSPYITECPYCGTRLRKRAPKIERPDAPVAPPKRGSRVRVPGRAAKAPKLKAPRTPRARRKADSPRLARLRAGEIPGIRGDEHGRPYATFVLVAASFGLWLSLAFYVRDDFVLTALTGDPWRFVTASLINDGTAAQFAAVVGVGLFGWLLERRHGPIAVIALFVLCGPAALAAAVAIDPTAVVFGTHGAALGLLCAWAVPVLVERRRSGDSDDDNDMIGAGVIAAVLLLVPLLSQGSALAGFIGAAFGALAGLLLVSLKPAHR